MAEPSSPSRPKSLDIQCLRCGALNIPENRICGRCGANLPLLYDEEGKIFNVAEDLYYQSAFKKSSFKMSPGSAAWFLRIALILLAVLAGLFLLRR